MDKYILLIADRNQIMLTQNKNDAILFSELQERSKDRIRAAWAVSPNYMKKVRPLRICLDEVFGGKKRGGENL